MQASNTCMNTLLHSSIEGVQESRQEGRTGATCTAAGFIKSITEKHFMFQQTVDIFKACKPGTCFLPRCC